MHTHIFLHTTCIPHMVGDTMNAQHGDIYVAYIWVHKVDCLLMRTILKPSLGTGIPSNAKTLDVFSPAFFLYVL
jgi:hypothetical protein